MASDSIKRSAIGLCEEADDDPRTVDFLEAIARVRSNIVTKQHSALRAARRTRSFVRNPVGRSSRPWVSRRRRGIWKLQPASAWPWRTMLRCLRPTMQQPSSADTIASPAALSIVIAACQACGARDTTGKPVAPGSPEQRLSISSIRNKLQSGQTGLNGFPRNQMPEEVPSYLGRNVDVLKTASDADEDQD
eukprot:546961-Rhodomonas_salina.1